MHTDFYRIERLPPYVFAEVNGMRAAMRARGQDVIDLGMGCFWGAERTFWQLPGVVTTLVGYEGGLTPNPTYEETTTGRTGHAEVVRVVYDPAVISTDEVLKEYEKFTNR